MKSGALAIMFPGLHPGYAKRRPGLVGYELKRPHGLRLLAFLLQQPLFALQPPAIAAEAAIAGHDTMAG